MKVLPLVICSGLYLAMTACDPGSIEYIPASPGEQNTETGTSLDNNPSATKVSSSITNSAPNKGTESDPIPVAWESTFEVSWEIESAGTNYISVEAISSGANVEESLGDSSKYTTIMKISPCGETDSCNKDYFECETVSAGGEPNLICEHENQDSGGKLQTIALFDKLPGISSLSDFPYSFQIITRVCSEAELLNCDVESAGYIELYTQ